MTKPLEDELYSDLLANCPKYAGLNGEVLVNLQDLAEGIEASSYIELADFVEDRGLSSHEKGRRWGGGCCTEQPSF